MAAGRGGRQPLPDFRTRYTFPAMVAIIQRWLSPLRLALSKVLEVLSPISPQNLGEIIITSLQLRFYSCQLLLFKKITSLSFI